MQAFFEGAMYTFVFNWVPTIINAFITSGYSEDFANINLGKVFAAMMVSLSLGGMLFERISSNNGDINNSNNKPNTYR